ncbi:MAG: hypothetical protein M3O70_02515 [Actinomycetota bacterium]|nr:hypothetical protein [Actinomycetota bacterium]
MTHDPTHPTVLPSDAPVLRSMHDTARQAIRNKETTTTTLALYERFYQALDRAAERYQVAEFMRRTVSWN